MPPITKIWLFSLHPSRTVDSAFTTIWQETLALVNSYTNTKPTANQQEQHILFQSETDPTQFAFITGYPSVEMNEEADGVYAGKIMPRMFEIVQHQRLMTLEVDVDELPLEGGRVTLALRDSPPRDEGSGAGGWDVWLPPGSKEQPQQTTWIDITATGEEDKREASTTQNESVWKLKRIMGI